MRGFSSEQETELLDQWENTTFRIFGLCGKDARTGVGDYVRLAWDIQNKPELDANKILGDIANLGESHSINEALSQPENKNWYEGWEPELRYLLFRYEEHLAAQRGQQITNEQWDRLWTNSEVDSIEHIFPQSSGSPKPLPVGKTGVYVHRLGNLMILPPNENSRLGGKDPKEKADDYIGTGLLSAIEVAQTIQQDGWGMEQVKEREKRLIKWIRETWGSAASDSNP